MGAIKNRKKKSKSYKAQFQSEMNRKTILLIGKHKGKSIEEVKEIDQPYFAWLHQNFKIIY
jgi:hypothetical protein